VTQGQILKILNQDWADASQSHLGDLILTVQISKEPIISTSPNRIASLQNSTVQPSRGKMQYPQKARHTLNSFALLDLSLSECVLGTEVLIQTPLQRVFLTIPAGTQSGSVFRVKGHGFWEHGKEPGDHFVTVRARIPKQLNPQERQLFETLQQLEMT
jgi:DnaJ-class molecular chaperone